MATRNGSYQNYARIEWVYSTSGRTVSATAYLRMDQYRYQQYNGTKSWSGSWGSGSGSQGYYLGANERVQIVTGSATAPVTGGTLTFSVTARHFFGSTSDTLTVVVGASKPGAPTLPKAELITNTSVKLNWNRNATYTSVIVQRRDNGGSWKQVGRPTGNAATFTDTTVKANNRYEYRMAGVNSGGQSNWSTTSATIYTVPGKPGGVTATRHGNDIRVAVSGLPTYATHFDILDNGVKVGSAIPKGSLPWTHLSPSQLVTHRYTVQGRVASGGEKSRTLIGPESDPSNTVQLLAPPLAPTNLKPNGSVVPNSQPVVFSWTHQSVDSSPQVAFELRRRISDGGGGLPWVTISGGEESSVSLDFNAASNLEWQVRTRGDHPDWSPWSASATVTVIDPPGIFIVSPTPEYGSATIVSQWTFFQAQDWPQSAWEIELLDEDGATLEKRSGSGPTNQVILAYRLRDGVTATLRVRAASSGVWSEWAAVTFTGSFIPPAPAEVEASWSEETGAHILNIEDGRGTSGPISTIINQYIFPSVEKPMEMPVGAYRSTQWAYEGTYSLRVGTSETEGLYPALDLYPATDLYPEEG